MSSPRVGVKAVHQRAPQGASMAQSLRMVPPSHKQGRVSRGELGQRTPAICRRLGEPLALGAAVTQVPDLQGLRIMIKSPIDQHLTSHNPF